MKHLCWLTVLVLLGVARGEEAAVPDKESLAKELAGLDRTPVAVEVQELSKALSAIMGEQQQRINELNQKRNRLMQSEAYQEYRAKREKLEAQQNTAWEAERKALAAAAKSNYSARHAEIKERAAKECPQARALGLDVLTYPRVDGSTSTQPLSVVLACRVLGVPYEWSYPEPSGHRRGHEMVRINQPFFLPALSRYSSDYEWQLATLKVFAKPGSKEPERKEQERKAVMINSLLAVSTSTHDAYVNLIAGTSDLNLTARPPSESELKLAKEKGITVKLEPIARDALVFIVNKQNPVKSLTRQQTREIYEEKITDWKSVGGTAGKISAFRRERDSGSRELFDALVMQGQALPEDDGYESLYAQSMAGPYNQLTGEPAGLGYSVYYYEHFMAASPSTRTVAIDGIAPTAETIAAGTYPWVTRVYAAYREGEAPDSPAMKLLRWLVSAEGQAVVRESGYVPEK